MCTIVSKIGPALILAIRGDGKLALSKKQKTIISTIATYTNLQVNKLSLFPRSKVVMVFVIPLVMLIKVA